MRVFFDKFPNAPFSSAVLRQHKMTKGMFVDTLKKLIQSAREKVLSNGWATMFLIMTFSAKISPREGNHQIKQ